MKIALFGAGGTIGSRIAREAVSRGHQVTAVARKPEQLTPPASGIQVVQGDVLDPASVAAAVAGSDLVISAIGPGLPDGDPQLVVTAAHSLIDGVKRAGVRRLLVVGGAGSLEVGRGMLLVDTPGFPPGWKPIALAHSEALDVYRTADLDWTYVSPAALIEPGERTGHYRTGTDQLLTDEKGHSRISAEDYAVAMLDEAEHPQFVRRRMTAAY